MPLIAYSPVPFTNTITYDGIDDNTILMLHADDLTDSSRYHRSITSTVTLDTNNTLMGLSAFKFNQDTMLISNSTDFAFGTKDFTIDFWMRQPNTLPQTLCGGRSANRWAISFYDLNPSVLAIYVNGLGWPISHGTTVVTDGNWHHIALVRYGSTLTLYIDGLTELTMNISPSYSWTFQDFNIGGQQTQDYTGWIDEFRVSSGIARWTAPFVPRSTPYQDVGNGDDSNNILLLHFDNTNLPANQYLDSTIYNHTVNGIGTTSSSYQYGKFVWGINFGNAAGYLSIPSSNDFVFSNKDWTVDFWVKFTTTANVICSLFCTGTNNKGIYLKYTGGVSTGQLNLLLGDGVLYTTHSTPFTPTANTWYHLAVTRHLTLYNIFINGRLSMSIVNPILIEGTSEFLIGSDPTYTISYRMYGYMDEFRVSKGVVRYTENFIPWTSPYGGFPALPPPVVSFTDLVDVNLNSTYTQSSLMTGPITPLSISISGANASYSLDGTNFVSTTGTINPGSTVWIRLKSNNVSLSMSTATLTIGTTVFTWSITTKYTTIDGSTLLLVNNNPSLPNFSDMSTYGTSYVVHGSPTVSSPLFSFNSIDCTVAGSLSYTNSIYAIGAGDFTVEFWIYRLGTIGTTGVFSSGMIGGAGGFTLQINSNTLTFGMGNNNGTTNLISDSIPLNSWTHYAWVRKTLSNAIYKNGIPVFVGTYGGAPNSTSVGIGARYGSGDYPISNALLSNVRFSNVARFGSFDTSTSISNDAQTTFLIKGVGSPLITGSVSDDTGRHSITNNNVTITDSIFFNGFNSYLSLPDSPDWYFAGIDVTIEAWIIWNGSVASGILWNQLSGTTNNMIVGISNTSGRISAGIAGSYILNSTINIAINEWTHVAFQKLGTTYTLYINGQFAGSIVSTAVLKDLTTDWSFGAHNNGTSPFSGNMKEIRISNIARYPTSFTPSTIFSTDANTLLLIHGNNGTAAVVQEENGKLNTPLGWVNISNTVFRFNNNSLYFDGLLGGYIALPSAAEYALNADFTIEFWFYTNSLPTNGLLMIVSNVDAPTYTTDMWYLTILSRHFAFICKNAGNIIETSQLVAVTTWYNIAIVRQGNTYGLFVNGILTGYLNSINNADNRATSPLFIGPKHSISATSTSPSFYIDDFRLSNGVARYPINFPLPTSDYV